MTRFTTFLMYSGWYLTMAIGGCLFSGAFALVRFKMFGYDPNSSDALTVVMESTAMLMSGILVFGRFYCRFFPCDSATAMGKFMNWRIQLLHLITIVAISIDVAVKMKPG